MIFVMRNTSVKSFVTCKYYSSASEERNCPLSVGSCLLINNIELKHENHMDFIKYHNSILI